MKAELVIALSLLALAALLTALTRGKLGKSAAENEVDGKLEDLCCG